MSTFQDMTIEPEDKKLQRNRNQTPMLHGSQSVSPITSEEEYWMDNLNGDELKNLKKTCKQEVLLALQ